MQVLQVGEALVRQAQLELHLVKVKVKLKVKVKVKVKVKERRSCARRSSSCTW